MITVPQGFYWPSCYDVGKILVVKRIYIPLSLSREITMQWSEFSEPENIEYTDSL